MKKSRISIKLFIVLCLMFLLSRCTSDSGIQICDENEVFCIELPTGTMVQHSSPNPKISTISFNLLSTNSNKAINYLVAWESVKTIPTNETLTLLNELDYKPGVDVIYVKSDKLSNGISISTKTHYQDSISRMNYEVRQEYLTLDYKPGTIVFTVSNVAGAFTKQDSIQLQRIISSVQRI